MLSKRSELPPRLATKLSLESLLESAGDAVFRTDRIGRIFYASQHAHNIISAENGLEGSALATHILAEDWTLMQEGLTEALAFGTTCRVNVRLNTTEGILWFELQITAYETDDGQVEFLILCRDIAEQHANEERLRHMATHDELTGLPNRFLLSDRLRMTIAQARRTGVGFSVLALNIDGFKKVNDALGHPIGDILLRVAGERLREALRDVDTLARVGGDEFAAVLPGAVDLNEIQTVARRMISTTQLPFEIEGHLLYVSSSIGVATYPQHGDNEVKLRAHADTALYRAKEGGKSRCVIYDVDKFNLPEHDVSMEAAMFDAVRNGEFRLFYQPIIEARSRQIVGFETLMRWEHPELGSIPPTQFIPMAESNGLINLLGGWALKAACVQIRHFEEAAGRNLYVSVNVSPRQFRNDQFLEVMDDALKLSGLNGSQLLLEITEGILMSDPEHAETLLTAIATRNVRVAIDDFGTGYSSLAYLKHFPISVLKIDRAFIKDLPESIKDVAICNVVLSLASHLNLTTIAEGVENEHQMHFLTKQGCAMIQGFLTGRPLPPADAIEVLKTGVLPTMPVAEHAKLPA
ncbi:MAG: putative bifunctional diguanylate cyclase/phosphodiesterase [Burkholderiales bacterium]